MTKLILNAEDFRKFSTSGLYRHFDAEGRLLYIGESENMLVRLASHLSASPWGDEIYTVHFHPMSKKAARKLEAEAIASEVPLHNKAYHPINKKQRRNRSSKPERCGLYQASEITGIDQVALKKKARMGLVPGAIQFGRVWTFNIEQLTTLNLSVA